MSETADTARNEAGQFTPDTSNLFGRDYELVSNGFTVKEKEPQEAAIESSDPVRQAAAELAARRAAPENLSVVEVKNSKDFEPKEARTLAESEAKRPPIPTEGGHRFRSKAATRSGRRRPPC
jgi:hypothetical protein